ncbi:MAG: hypothetical protein V4858_00900 [Pseudomonadota bacterium]
MDRAFSIITIIKRLSPPFTRSGLVAALCACTVTLPLATLTTIVHSAEVSGQVRGAWVNRQVADAGPLAEANRLQPGTAATEPSAATVQAELRAAGNVGPVTLNAVATLQARNPEGGTTDTEGWFNEAYASGKVLGWQWSAGKKVVSWDVGYGFRPNDMVQQEVRRTLASEALTGRPLLMAEHFDADTAWSLVWVNPLEAQDGTGAKEAALAARVYRRSGAVDWHGFARQGEHTGASLGAAASWVASDAIELHASLRAYQHVDSINTNNAGSSLSSSTPWQPTRKDAGQQVLVGGTWTHESQIGIMLEAWHDDTALSDAQWSDWSARNQALPLWLVRRVPASAVAGNLAWQGHAFGVSNNLRQDNVFVRLSWQHERWQTALDVLYTPADQGHVDTASVVWSGDHVKLEAGIRTHGGPDNAIVRQVPVQRQAYVVGTWAF